ncbi:helicase-related protein, partial [Streptomyces xiamenensis]|uniref:helicase-related protein n=1 Tax=Streptomyces xiamenensis TaxID=408015 RepID=UPI0035D866D3
LSVPDEAKGDAAAVAGGLLERHVPGTRTLAFVNTVRRAEQVAAEVTKQLKGRSGGPSVVLVHAQFRPGERAELVGEALAEPGAAGLVVVTTQALEAGADISSRVLFLEACPWSSVVQRCGRSNRYGEWAQGADVLWAVPPGGPRGAAPYAEEDLVASVAVLEGWEGRLVTTVELTEAKVAEERPVFVELRRRDVVQLWDTSADLSGADVDVSRWVRAGEDHNAQVAWRAWEEGRPGEGEPVPRREELCPAPVADLRELAGKGRLWVRNQVEGGWQRAGARGVRPGERYLMDAAGGGYRPRVGWSPASRAAVEVIGTTLPAEAGEGGGLGSDPRSRHSRWVTLAEHGQDVRTELAGLLEQVPAADISAEMAEAALLAALHHDIGKSHKVFAQALTSGGPGPGPGPWAKSPHHGRYWRPYFRHELVSALMLLDPSSGLLEGSAEADLAAFLAAAHHGKVRLAVRPVGQEAEEPAQRILGVEDGESVGPVDLGAAGVVPQVVLDLSGFEIGGGRCGRSWVQRVTALRDRPD